MARFGGVLVLRWPTYGADNRQGSSGLRGEASTTGARPSGPTSCALALGLALVLLHGGDTVVADPGPTTLVGLTDDDAPPGERRRYLSHLRQQLHGGVRVVRHRHRPRCAGKGGAAERAQSGNLDDHGGGPAPARCHLPELRQPGVLGRPCGWPPRGVRHTGLRRTPRTNSAATASTSTAVRSKPRPPTWWARVRTGARAGTATPSTPRSAPTHSGRRVRLAGDRPGQAPASARSRRLRARLRRRHHRSSSAPRSAGELPGDNIYQRAFHQRQRGRRRLLLGRHQPGPQRALDQRPLPAPPGHPTPTRPSSSRPRPLQNSSPSRSRTLTEPSWGSAPALTCSIRAPPRMRRRGTRSEWPGRHGPHRAGARLRGQDGSLTYRR